MNEISGKFIDDFVEKVIEKSPESQRKAREEYLAKRRACLDKAREAKKLHKLQQTIKLEVTLRASTVKYLRQFYNKVSIGIETLVEKDASERVKSQTQTQTQTGESNV